jgi:hypothetical protein
MKYKGIIGFQRELTFSQAQQLCQFLKENEACLNLLPNGKGLQWDNKTTTPNLETVIADALQKFFLPWSLGATGVITVGETKKEKKYDIVIFAKTVWVYDGKVKRVAYTNQKFNQK